MSKAFTRDGDAWEAPVVPPRPPLPAGVANYVTPRGLLLLRAELAELQTEREGLDSRDEAEHRRRQAILSRRLSDVRARIASAQVVDPRRQPHDRVRFGAGVTLRTMTGNHAGEERRIEIVGVDEADAAKGLVAFVAPIARALLGRETGDTVSLPTAGGEESIQILAIEYPTG